MYSCDEPYSEWREELVKSLESDELKSSILEAYVVWQYSDCGVCFSRFASADTAYMVDLESGYEIEGWVDEMETFRNELIPYERHNW